MARITLEDLDRSDRPEPLEVELPGGAVITMPPPMSLHFTKLLQLLEAEPAEQVRVLLSDEDLETLTAMPEADGYLLVALATAYNEHFGPPAGSSSAPAPENAGKD